jgi:hypothetical protein
MEITHKKHQSLQHQSDQSAYAVWEDQRALLLDVYALKMPGVKAVFLL